MREDFGLVAAGIATLAALVFLRQREAIPLGTLTK
jgi:hypothetical protein